MKLNATTTRRSLLQSALGLGLALSLGSRAHAATNPFNSLAPWSGFATSENGSVWSATPVELSISPNGISGFLQVGTAAPVAVSLGFNTQTGEALISGPGITIAGLVLNVNGAPVLSTSYQINSDTGTLTLIRNNSQGLISPDFVEINIASLEIVPPDFVGRFLDSNNNSGPLRFHHDVGRVRVLPRFNKVRGQLVLGSTEFASVMTFAPRPDQNGVFAFDLIGDTGRFGAPLLMMRGGYLPGTRTTPGRMEGPYQLLGTRGALLGTGRYQILQVR
ncbi:hypothetical protein [Armatimonas sp.]|uniref:hypothetical protein n=1 Tax=Armatimonas sp. TaxID=1872638 RepID=UPI00286B08A2|nr:hypothetical protein [Armatimonas sp.]